MFDSLIERVFKTRVRFDDGTSVRFLDRELVRVEDSTGRILDVDLWYTKAHRAERVLNPDRLRRWIGSSGSEELTEEERQRIIQMVGEYCRRRGVALRLEPSVSESDK